MKKTITLLLSIVLLFGLVGSVGAASKDVPMFKVNGKLFVTPTGEPAPYINKDNRTMGSLRLIASALGVENKNITWSSATNTATLVRGENTVSVVVGKKEITVNGKKVVMDTVSEMKKGRVFIPARFIAQGLGVKISFDNASNTVHFTTGTTEVATNNFADYGMKVLEQLPITIKANNLEITYHEAFLYKTTSAEGKALYEKYTFPRYNRANHVLFLKVTITNKGTKTIAYDYSDLEPKIRASYATSRSFEISLANNNSLENKGDYINKWSLEPGKSITGHVALLKNDDADIQFVDIMTVNKDILNFNTLAEKEE